MSINLKKHKEDLFFLPLGGSGEIGMNLNLYHLDGKWLMIDCGAGFADDHLPGINMILSDYRFIKDRKKDLVGLVLTHAHEDHLGAISHIWEEFGNIPIYATPFTASFLKAKLDDNKRCTFSNIIEVPIGSSFNIDPFEIELAGLTHSAPEMNAVILRTRYGNVFHTGDWKLDPDPVIGEASDKVKLKKLGKEGVLAMVGDSTNVFSAGVSGSEGELLKSLTKIISKCENLVVVTTFASNVARIQSLCIAAEKAGRRIILAGRSLWRISDAAQENGYLTDFEFLEDDAINRFPRDKLLVIATGCQGEPLAATNKIVNGSHRAITLKEGDTVIFSSKIIPGNDKRINLLFNKLVKNNIETITERNHFVHVSGHPNRDELKEMYQMIKPQISVPVHGEDVHMQEHARLAKEWGVKTAIKIENGQLLRLAPNEPEKIKNVESGVLAIDGHSLIEEDSPIIKMRRRLQSDGIMFVIIYVNKNFKLVKDPIIYAPGVLDIKKDIEIFEAIVEEIHYVTDYNKSKKKHETFKNFENKIRSAIRSVLKVEKGKSPLIEIHFEEF